MVLRTTGLTRQERLLIDLEALAIEAVSIANRYAACRAEMCADAAARSKALLDAADAIHDAHRALNRGQQSYDLQLFFGIRKHLAPVPPLALQETDAR